MAEIVSNSLYRVNASRLPEISKKSKVWGLLNKTPHHRASLSIYSQGIEYHAPKYAPVYKGKFGATDSKRGKITSFTNAATRRLRHAFLTMDIPQSRKFGWTLTLPWPDEVFGNPAALEWWAELLNLVQVTYRRKAPKSGYIYRIELQSRGAPHIHAVEYVSNGSSPLLGEVWLECVLKVSAKHKVRYNLADFAAHGVRSDNLNGAGHCGYFRYLTDHASKHKESQLGYQGKQWGIVNKGAFQVEKASTLVRFEDDDTDNLIQVLFVRYFQRFNRYPVTVKDCNGKRRVVKYRRNRRSCGDSFLRGGSATAERLLSLARANAKCYVPRGTFVKQPVDTAE